MVHDATVELEAWPQESGLPLPLPACDIVRMEAGGKVVDLRDGSVFVQCDKWQDFAERWVMEMGRRGERPTVERLAKAIYRACGGVWAPNFCSAVADKTLLAAMKNCTAQVVA